MLPIFSSSGEAARIAVLQKYEILDTSPEPAFDDLARLAAFCCQTPIAAINFVDGERVWSKASVGLPVQAIPRTYSVCTYTIMGGDLCVIPDTTQDPRLADNRLVTDAPRLRFYAGVPLLTPEGYAIGTLCVMDVTPRILSPEQQNALQGLARQVTTQLELRRNVSELQREIAERQATEEALRKSQQELSLFTEQSFFAVLSLDRNFIITGWNGAAEKIFGFTRAEVIGRHPVGLLTPEKHAELLERGWQEILRRKEPVHGSTENFTRDGRILVCEWYITPLLDSAGEVTGIIAIAQDVTEAVQAQQEVQESEARFRTLFETAPLGICIVRREKLLYANAATATMFGNPELQQQRDISVLDFLSPEAQGL